MLRALSSFPVSRASRFPNPSCPRSDQSVKKHEIIQTQEEIELLKKKSEKTAAECAHLESVTEQRAAAGQALHEDLNEIKNHADEMGTNIQGIDETIALGNEILSFHEEEMERLGEQIEQGSAQIGPVRFKLRDQHQTEQARIAGRLKKAAMRTERTQTKLDETIALAEGSDAACLALHEEQRAVGERIEALEKDHAVALERRDQTADQARVATERAQRAADALADQERANREAKAKNDDENEEAQRRMEEHARATAELVRALKKAEDGLECEREKAVRAHEELEQAEEHLRDTSQELAAARTALEEVNADIIACDARVRQLDQEADALDRACAQKRTEVKETNNRRKALEAQLNGDLSHESAPVPELAQSEERLLESRAANELLRKESSALDRKIKARSARSGRGESPSLSRMRSESLTRLALFCGGWGETPRRAARRMPRMISSRSRRIARKRRRTSA